VEIHALTAFTDKCMTHSCLLSKPRRAIISTYLWPYNSQSPYWNPSVTIHC